MTNSKLRVETPSRRTNPPIKKRYGDYKPELAEDFKNRCGYCGASIEVLSENYWIDHFIPRNPKGWTHNIPDNKYSNLVFSCPYCNRAKSNKWPTEDPARYNDGEKGFIDPCSTNYDELFQRNENGKIEPANGSNLGKYIWQELKLWALHHPVVWQIENLQKRVEILIALEEKGEITDIESYKAFVGVLKRCFSLQRDLVHLRIPYIKKIS